MGFDFSRMRERVDERQPAPRTGHKDMAFVAVRHDGARATRPSTVERPGPAVARRDASPTLIARAGNVDPHMLATWRKRHGMAVVAVGEIEQRRDAPLLLGHHASMAVPWRMRVGGIAHAARDRAP